MGTSLFIHRVAINPPKGKTDVTFREGLNVIRAVLHEKLAEQETRNQPGTRNSVGKTTFVHLLDYGLGRTNFLTKDKTYGRQELQSHDLLLEFRIGDKEYTVDRNLVNGKVCRLYQGWVIAELLSGVQLSGERYPLADYTKFLEQQLFMGANEYEDKRIVTYRDVMQLLIRDQVGGFEAIDKPGNYTANADSKRKLMRFVTGLMTSETLSADKKVLEAEEIEKETKKAFDIIKRYVNHKVNQLEEGIRAEAIEVNQQIETKKSEINNLKKQLISLQERADERTERKQKLLQKKIAFEKEEQLLGMRLNSFQATLNEIQTEKTNLETATEARHIMGTFDYEKCPVCLIPITDDPSFTCPRKSGDHDDLHQATETMQTILSNEKEDLIQAIGAMKSSLEGIEGYIRNLDAEIDNINLEISADANDILTALQVSEEQLKELGEKQMGLQQDLDYFKDQEAYQKNHRLAKDNLTDAKGHRNRIQQKMDESLENLKIYFNEAVSYLYFNERIGRLGLSDVAKNFQAEIRYLTSSEGKDSGAAAITLAVIAFDLALLKLAMEQESPHPKLLIHDSPNINDIDPLVYNRIFTYTTEILETPYLERGEKPPFQYIITTILTPKELDKEPYIRLELHNNGDEGKLFEFTF